MSVIEVLLLIGGFVGGILFSALIRKVIVPFFTKLKKAATDVKNDL